MVRLSDTANMLSHWKDHGYCARGAFCRYSHGDDAMVPGQLFPMSGVPMVGSGLPFMPIFPSNSLPFAMAAPGAAYDPHESQMDMRPHTSGVGSGRSMPRVPMMPRMIPDDGNILLGNPGELPVIQDLTPKIPSDDVLQRLDDQGSKNAVGASDALSPMIGLSSLDPVYSNGSADIEMGSPSSPGTSRRASRSSRAQGTFDGDAQSFRPERRNDKTLVVEKIPEDKLTLEAISGWFKTFGAVTHVAVDARNAKALVSFSDHSEAHAAWKSKDAVFNNRFVKLFWHRPMEGQGQAGTRMLAASAPLVANIAAKESTAVSATAQAQEPSVSSVPLAKPPPPVQKVSHSSGPASMLAAKKELLDRQIAEQKSLMKLLDSASPDGKKEIMARLRKLGEEMVLPPAPTSASPNSTFPVRSQSSHEQKERERLDKELDLHASNPPVEESTEDLKAKLAKLKAEVYFRPS